MASLIRSERMAVLISGQVRSDDSDIELISQACQGLDADIFVCVWRKRGTKGFGGGQGLLQLTRIFGNELTIAMPRNWIGANMRHVFPESGHILPDLGNLTEDGLAEIFPDAQIQILEDRDDLTIPYMDSNSLRMLYMINKCNEMKRQAELTGGFVYGSVVRHRPDIRLDYARAVSHFHEQHKVLLPKSDVTINHLHDIYWVCSSEDDNLLTSLYNHAENTREKGWNGIHNELFDWTIKNNIRYEMYPCATSGLNDAKKGNTATQRLAAKNFVNAVKNKQFYVDFAGGRYFSETYALVFDSILNGKFLDDQEIENRLKGILKQKLKPKQKLFLLQAVCWLVCFNTNRDNDDRFGSLLVALAIDDLTNNQRAAKWAASVSPSVFATIEGASELTLFLLDNAPSYFRNPSLPATIRQMIVELKQFSDEEIARAVEISCETILFENQNWKWFVSNLQSQQDYDLIIRICETQLQKGIYQKGLVNQAIRASHLLDDRAKTAALHKTAAYAVDTSKSYADLGRFLENTGDFDQAIKAYELACNRPNTPDWVFPALSNLESR